MAHHLIAFELIIQLFYINFPSLQSKTFLKDVKSTLLSSVALSFRNLSNISLSASLVTPYASNLAVNKSCGKQSKALDKSIKMAPIRLFSSRHLCQVSINLRKTWSQL